MPDNKTNPQTINQWDQLLEFFRRLPSMGVTYNAGGSPWTPTPAPNSAWNPQTSSPSFSPSIATTSHVRTQNASSTALTPEEQVAEAKEAEMLGMTVPEYRTYKKRIAITDIEKQDLAKQQFDWQKQQQQQEWNQSEATKREQAANIQNIAAQLQQQMQGSPGVTYSGKEQMSRDLLAAQSQSAAESARMKLDQMASSFESMRNEIMSSAAPRDWVVREKARLAINPYEVAKQKWIPYQGVNNQDTAQRNIDQYGEQLSNITSNLTAQYSGTPQMPGDVQQFTRGQGFGAPIETPSGQSWMASPWSTQQKLIGYGEAMGTPESDLLGNIKSMLPNNPSRGTAWTSARRR